MSAYEVAKFCRTCLRDPDLRRLAQNQPETALERFHLSDAERVALLSGEVGQLYWMGVPVLLLSYLPRWKIFGLDVDTYSRRMRAAADHPPPSAPGEQRLPPPRSGREDMNRLRETVALSSRILGHAGHGDLIWGHSSARDAENRGVWMKVSTWGMEEITPDRVHLVDADGTVLEGGGPQHSEYPIHTEIMAARPDVGGVVHTHSRFAVALAASGQPLRPVSHEGTFFCPPGVPRFTRTADLILTPALGQAVAAALGSAPALFLVNHGIVCVGPDLETATVTAILLDRACQQQLLTGQGDGRPTWSDDEESVQKRQHIYPPASMHHVWDYLVRQLADPPE